MYMQITFKKVLFFETKLFISFYHNVNYLSKYREKMEKKFCY